MGGDDRKGGRMSDTATLHRVPSSGRVGNDILFPFALKGSTSQEGSEGSSGVGTHAEEEDQRRRAPVRSNEEAVDSAQMGRKIK